MHYAEKERAVAGGVSYGKRCTTERKRELGEHLQPKAFARAEKRCAILRKREQAVHL